MIFHCFRIIFYKAPKYFGIYSVKIPKDTLFYNRIFVLKYIGISEFIIKVRKLHRITRTRVHLTLYLIFGQAFLILHNDHSTDNY